MILDFEKSQQNRIESVTRTGLFQGRLTDELWFSGFRGDLRHRSNAQELPQQTSNRVQRNLRRAQETHQQEPKPCESQVTNLPQG